MKGLALVIIGVAVGFLVAHQVSKTSEGKRFLSEVDSRAREFGGAVRDGYTSREAELRAAVEASNDDLPGLTDRR